MYWFVIPGLPTVTQQASCDLPPDSSCNIGLGLTNEVLVGRRDTETITKYNFCDTLTVIWEKTSPQEMKYYCEKFITGSGDIILHNCKTATHLYTSDLVLQSQHVVGGDMLLLSVTTDTLLYRDKHDGQFAVDIYNMRHEKMDRLRPPLGREWKYLLAVCVVGDSGNVMVTDQDNKWLDVFSAGGTIIFYG